MADEGVEFTGKTVDEAIRQAEVEHGADRSSMTIEIISQGARGVFGIGAEPARIRIKRPSTTAPAGSSETGEILEGLETPSEHYGASSPTSTAGEQVQGSEERLGQDDAALTAEAIDVVENILRGMGIDATVTVQSEGTPLTLEVHGSNLGILIGRRGDNLSALQFMVNLILSKNRRHWPRVVLDVEQYRTRREESLRTLSDRVAFRVGRNGRPFTLEAMTASDRRIIHLALRDRPDIETYSIGEGPARRVVVAPKRDDRGASQPSY